MTTCNCCGKPVPINSGWRIEDNPRRWCGYRCFIEYEPYNR